MADTLRVPYQLPGSRAWQWVNIYTRMSQERIIFLNQPLTTGLANSIVSALLYLDSEDQSKPIYIYINSYGDPVAMGQAGADSGSMAIASCLAIYDTMQHIKSDIVTIGMGQAVGISAVLLAAGTPGKRGALPHASIALTATLAGARGQASDIQVSATEILQKRTLIREILAQSTGQTVAKIAADMNRTLYLSPEEAKEYGLIDQVLYPQKNGAAIAGATTA